MTTLLWGSLIFGVSFALHLLVWKIHVPKRQTKALLFIMFGTLIIGFVILGFLPSDTAFAAIRIPQNWPDFLHMILYVTSLILAYMITYSAIEADSPSLTLVLKISQAGEKGLGPDEIAQAFNDELLIKPRLNDLITDKMVYMSGNGYRLTGKGIFLAKLFAFHRRILLLQKKGG